MLQHLNEDWMSPNISRSSSLKDNSLQLFRQSMKSSSVRVVLHGLLLSANLHLQVSS